jgi:hypothetical protein
VQDAIYRPRSKEKDDAEGLAYFALSNIIAC